VLMGGVLAVVVMIVPRAHRGRPLGRVGSVEGAEKV